MTRVRRGASNDPNPVVAARELAAQLSAPNIAAAIFFCSAAYDMEQLGEELYARFECADMIGCSTAGEIAGGYFDHALVGLSFSGGDFITVTDRCDDLSVTPIARVCAMTSGLLRKLRLRAPSANASNTFAVLLIDGLSSVEETIISAIHRELGDIPLVGGSAGDTMKFRETVVFHAGSFRSGSAVLALIHTWLPFEVFKTQHIVSSNEKMVITEADPVSRVVTEINAEPASAEYARLLGVEGQALQPMVLATHPVVVRVGGDDYVRSIQKVNEDGSLTFYCAIDEGIVLAAGSATNIVTDLDSLFTRLRATIGPPQAVLGFDCIFRRLELEERNLIAPVSQLLAANNVVGFSTYGEQFHAMHLNQTFSGVAFGSPPEKRS